MKLDEYIARLDAAHWPHFETPIPWADDGTRVHAIGATQVWIVDFSADGTFQADVFELDTPPGKPITDPEALSRSFGRLAAAWREAAVDLSIRIESPFFLARPGDTPVACAVYLPDFGGPIGTVLLSRNCSDEAHELADERGYYMSALSPQYYERYDRAGFVEALTDWGWTGNGPAPSWLVPQP